MGQVQGGGPDGDGDGVGIGVYDGCGSSSYASRLAMIALASVHRNRSGKVKNPLESLTRAWPYAILNTGRTSRTGLGLWPGEVVLLIMFHCLGSACVS
jgi:hypothetical protein